MRLPSKSVKRYLSNSGEIDSLLWHNISFSWIANIDGNDEYAAQGLFLGLKKDTAYHELKIVVNWVENNFRLLTGKGVKITWVNLLNDML